MTDPDAPRAAGLMMPDQERLHELPQGEGFSRGRAASRAHSTSTRRGSDCSIRRPKIGNTWTISEFPKPAGDSPHKYVGHLQCANATRVPRWATSTASGG